MVVSARGHRQEFHCGVLHRALLRGVFRQHLPPPPGPELFRIRRGRPPAIFYRRRGSALLLAHAVLDVPPQTVPENLRSPLLSCWGTLVWRKASCPFPPNL